MVIHSTVIQIQKVTGKFYSGMPAEDASAVFGELLANPVEMGILAVAIVIVGFVVCSFGLWML